MKNITFDYYTAIIFLNIFAMMILQTCISRSNTLTTTCKKLFRCLYALIIVVALCEWIGNQLQASGALTRKSHSPTKQKTPLFRYNERGGETKLRCKDKTIAG